MSDGAWGYARGPPRGRVPERSVHLAHEERVRESERERERDAHGVPLRTALPQNNGGEFVTVTMG